ncbi:MAG: DUF2330 domain-containing protein [Rhodospirillales bacterium]|nr:MAG: DUF2330 domain-containing protein [Rhodospirillales bacterium]
MILRATIAAAALSVPLALAPGAPASAFCGFYVGKADSSLFNEASQVILARDGRRTTLSMLNDYKGALTEFALVVPVPVVLRREQVKVIEKKTFERLDSYSAPRLAEYFDEDPCAPRPPMVAMAPSSSRDMAGGAPRRGEKALGVTVEDSFSVGEYDIVILSATESDGLETWLTQNGYRIPAGAAPALRPYILQGMKFFVAKVNLKEQAKTGGQFLRPIQFTFESEKFMLPMRLGMINAQGPQDMIVYVLSKTGRVESTNYRTVKLPANMDLPTCLRDPGRFKDFYKAMFDRRARDEGFRAVFTEYVWDMAWCDPCAADPLSRDELLAAGVTWLGEGPAGQTGGQGRVRPTPMPPGAAPVTLTRLHVRYTRESFPEDLALQETGDRQNFQTRYVLRHPWSGPTGATAQCPAAVEYGRALRARQEREVQTLSNLTGWNIDEVRRRQREAPAATPRR